MSIREPRSAQTRDKQRRTPPGQPRLKLRTENVKDGYRAYWAAPRQFEELLDAGYEFVRKESGVKAGDDRTSGDSAGSLVTRGQGEQKLTLMQIPQEWFEENEAIKQGKIKDMESAITRQKPGEDREKFYTPDEHHLGGTPNKIYIE